jgi:hypothetical protein
MHHYGSKRKQIAIRFFSYGVMTLATIVFSFICILLILGYQFDLQKGTVAQGGLLQFRSFPVNATVKLDNKVLSFKTPGKQNVETGRHTVVMNLDGYREWSKSFAIKAGELRWLNYARFIPNSITTSPVKNFDLLTGSLPSPDRRWLALYGAPESPSFTIADLRDEKNLKYQVFTIPVTQYTAVEGQTNTFQLKEWDFGARYLLIQHQSGDKVEFIRADRTDPSSFHNITTQFNLPISDIHFSGTSGNIFYALAGTDIRKFDIGAGTVSEPLATNVISFRLFKDSTIAYTAIKDAQTTVGVIVDGKATVVRAYDTTLPVYADINEYFDNLYLAIGRGTSLEIIKDPELTAGKTQKPLASAVLPEGIAWTRISAAGRFVVAGNGNHYVTYDLETLETSTTALPGTPADPKQPLQWLDDYYYVSDADGTLRLSEFDGKNQNIITDVAPGFRSTLSDDGKFLYSISHSGSAFSLQSSKMTID